MKYYLGIDPGVQKNKTGALALVDCDGKFCEIIDLPAKLKYSTSENTKRIINARQLENILVALIAEYGEIKAYLEDVHGRAGWNASVTFGLGETIGAIRSVLDMTGIEVTMITPTFWKKYFKLTSDKEIVRQRANDMYPAARPYLKRKKDHDRAEALLIAKYAAEIHRGKV